MSHERRTGRWWRDRFMAAHYGKIKSAEVLVGFMVHKGYVDRNGAGEPVYIEKRPQLQYSRFARQVSFARIDMTGDSSKKVSRQMLTQLCTGKRNSCTTDLAFAIEDVLDVPRGTIFDVLAKSRDTREITKGEARGGRAAA